MKKLGFLLTCFFILFSCEKGVKFSKVSQVKSNKVKKTEKLVGDKKVVEYWGVETKMLDSVLIYNSNLTLFSRSVVDSLSVSRTYNLEGDLIFECSTLNGVYEGIATIYSQGKIRSIQEYKKGVRTGIVIFLDEDQKIKSISHYKGTKPQGLTLKFYTGGGIEEILYLNSKKGEKPSLKFNKEGDLKLYSVGVKDGLYGDFRGREYLVK